MHESAPRMATKRAVAVVRVSKIGKRKPENFVSPEDQIKIIRNLTGPRGWTIVAIFEEMDVSGYRTQLDKRKGLYPAMLMIERGEADVVVMAFFDRMARNIIVQTEFLGRVGKAGGEVWAGDTGQIRTDTAAQAFSAGVLGLVNQMMAQQTAEKTQGAKERAIANGIPIMSSIPLGYRRMTDGSRRLEVDGAAAELVREAYRRREAGASFIELRDWLAAQGRPMSWRAAQEMLRNRIYLGELHFGKLVNPRAHEPIVDPLLFKAVQNMRTSRVRREKSVRLLARQGIVRCGSCNSRMVIGGQNRQRRGGIVRYVDYRCNPLGTCLERVSISADLLEGKVIRYMNAVRASGENTVDDRVAAAEANVKRLEEEMAATIAALKGLEHIQAARDKLLALNEELTEAQDYYSSLRLSLGSTPLTFEAWPHMDLQQQRALIRLVIERIVVTRGGVGEGRIKIEPFTR